MFGALKGFGARKALGSSKAATRRWPEVRASAAALIGVANRIEARATKRTGLETTNANDVIAARELIGAQEAFLKAMQTARGAGVEWSEIRTDLIEPVLESSVVSDLAWLTIHQMVARAEGGGRE